MKSSFSGEMEDGKNNEKDRRRGRIIKNRADIKKELHRSKGGTDEMGNNGGRRRRRRTDAKDDGSRE
jgi:hypothetical protein